MVKVKGMELHSLTYTSLAQIDLDETDLERIIYSARVNNALDGLTGFLLFNGGSFVQVLEGSKRAIDDVMARIAVDDRHRNVMVVDDRRVERRAFPDWSMGYLRFDGGVEGARALNRALGRETAEPVRALLTSMAAQLQAEA
jgi:hypothetical protein